MRRKREIILLRNYTAKYTKISSGYMGQLVEWSEVVTEAKTIEECREMLKDALHEIILAHKQQGKEISQAGLDRKDSTIYIKPWRNGRVD